MAPRPIRILYVLNSVGGGASLGIYEMLRGLPRHQFTPYAVAPPATHEELERIRPLFADVRLLAMPWWNVNPELGVARRAAIAFGRWRRGISTSRTSQGIVRAIRDWGIDIVHSSTALTLAGALAAREAGVPHVWHIKECIGRVNRVQFRMPDGALVSYMSGLSTRIVVMSEYIGRFFRAHGCQKVDVLPDGVDLDPYFRGTSRHLRQRLGLAEGELLVGMVASLASPWKQHHVFVRMVALLARQMPGVRFIAIGPQPRAKRWPHDLPRRYYEGLIRLTRDCVADGRLMFLDFVPDPPDIMRSLDVLVHTCSIEPFGRVAIEAMAAGTPVVGPMMGGVAETVVDGETGLLVTPGAPAAFARATRRLLREQSLRAHLGARGRLRAQTDYALPVHVARQTAIYERILG